MNSRPSLRVLMVRSGHSAWNVAPALLSNSFLIVLFADDAQVINAWFVGTTGGYDSPSACGGLPSCR